MMQFGTRIHKVLFTVVSLVLVAAVAKTAVAQNGDCLLLHEAAFLDEPSEITELLNNGVNVNCLDSLFHTPLITATTGASLDSFRVLLRAGAKTNVHDEWGLSALERVQEKMADYDTIGGETYRSIFEQMADMLMTPAAVTQ